MDSEWALVKDFVPVTYPGTVTLELFGEDSTVHTTSIDVYSDALIFVSKGNGNAVLVIETGRRRGDEGNGIHLAR